MNYRRLFSRGLAGLVFWCATTTSVQAVSNQLLNLPLPEDGFRYHSYAELEFQWPTNHGAGSVCLWGDDKFAAVSLTIDDNIPGDWPFWRQVSADYGWKITWFVIVHPYIWDVYNDVLGNNTSGFGTTENFKTLYEEGHDIQLHGNTDMNALTDPDYGDQMVRARAHMESVISNKMAFFAYPGGTPAAGIPEGVDRPAVARQLVSAARGGQGYGIAKPATLDYITIPTIGPALDTTSASSYWIKLEEKPANLLYSSYRGWAVLLNHKVSDQPSTLALFDYIKTNEFKYWVKPFSQVACYGQERDSSTLNVTTVTATQIDFTLTDLMSDVLFDVPLTIKFRVDGWAGATAVQNGQPVPVRVTNYNGNAYALVDAVPDKGPVTLSKSATVGFTSDPTSGWNPLEVEFTDTSTFAGITNRFWDFGNGVTTNTAETNVSHTYTVDGTYTVQLIVSGAEGVYTNTQVNLISVTTPVAPSAGFNASPVSGVAPLLVSFADTSTGTITNRYWSFGDGATTNTTATNFTHTYSVSGTNTVQLIVSGPAGTSTNTATVTVTVPVAPTANFTATPVSGTAPLAVSFTDTSTGSITNRTWSFGDGSTTNTTATSVAHTYTLSGDKTVQLIVSGPAGASTNTQSNIISVVSGSTGSLIIYDSFSSPTSTPLVAGWAPAGWTTDGTTANGDRGYIRGGSLTNSGLAVSEGNSLGLGAGVDDYMLSFTTVSLDIGDTVYFSFIEKYNVIPGAAVTGVGGFLRLANSNDAISTTKGICISRGSTGTPASSNAGFAIATGNKTFGVSPAVSTPGTYDMLATYFIVGSYTRGSTATNGSLKLWINPDSATFGTANPPAPTLSMASASSADTFNQLRIGSNGSGSHPSDWQIDEVRVATDWASVAPAENSLPNNDTDSDGLPNDWETQHFGGTTNANPNSMAANGINTVMETYVAGLNPTNPASMFLISELRPLTSGNILQWSAVSGRVYNVYWTTNLMNGFQQQGTNILWPQNSWTDLVHGAQNDGFYRLKVRMSP